MDDKSFSGTSMRMSRQDIVIPKAASFPLRDILSESQPELKPQISAPSYLFSLSENEAPPFKKPGKQPQPELLIGAIMNENDAIEMISFADSIKDGGLKSWLAKFLVDKNIVCNYCLSEKSFLVILLTEVVDYAAQRDFSAFKLSVLISIYIYTHNYFKWYYWLSPELLWNYFMEIIIRHTIEDSPYGQEVFEPVECYDILTHFHTAYMNNLPLIHILTFGGHRIKLRWPFTNQKDAKSTQK